MVALALVLCAGAVILGIVLRKEPAQSSTVSPTASEGSSVPVQEVQPNDPRLAAVLDPEYDSQEPTEDGHSSSGVAPASTKVELVAQDDQWNAQYASWSVAALHGELSALEKQIAALSAEPLKTRLDSGLYEEIGVGPDIPIDRLWDQALVMNVVIAPYGAEYYKVVLPRGEFPEIYLLNDKKQWLTGELQRRGQ